MSIDRILVFLVIIFTFSCKAQTILPIYGSGDFEYNSDFYLKDVTQEFNKFEGTWKCNVGDYKLIVTLQKKEMVQRSSGLFKDFLVGGFTFKENGNLIIESIFDTSEAYWEHRVNISLLIDRNFKPQCPSCPIDKLRPMGKIYHPEIEDVSAAIVLDYSVILEPFQETMKLTLWQNSPRIITPDRTDPYDFPIPDGDYIFVKQ